MKYSNSKVKEKFQEIFPEVGINKTPFIDRRTEVTVNQIITGHCQLNHHMAKLSDQISGNCPNCGEEETIQHFIYECPAYKTERHFLENDIENILHRYNESGHNLDLATITGQIDGHKQLKKELLSSFKNYLLSSNRFQ